jgi:hypothetical protein
VSSNRAYYLYIWLTWQKLLEDPLVPSLLTFQVAPSAREFFQLRRGDHCELALFTRRPTSSRTSPSSTFLAVVSPSLVVPSAGRLSPGRRARVTDSVRPLRAAAIMRRSTAIVWAVLAACCCITLSSLPSISGADSVVTSRTYNTRALEVAQASPPDMAQAVGLFEKAYNLERDNLRAERRRLRKQLERDDKASGYNEYEDEVETPEAHEIRSRIRQMKLNMGEYLNNWGVSELRRSNLYTSRRILLTAIRLVPGHTDAETNLQTVEDQFSITQPLDTPEDDDPIEPREPRQRRKKKNRRRRDYDDEEEEEDRRSSKKRKGGKKGSRQDDDSVYERPAKRRPLRTPDPEPNVDPATKRKKRKPVLDLPRRVNTNENRKFPRVHVDHLDLEENREYATGRSVEMHG